MSRSIMGCCCELLHGFAYDYDAVHAVARRFVTITMCVPQNYGYVTLLGNHAMALRFVNVVYD